MSIVRQNLLSQLNYTPYCGNVDCVIGMPRSVFNGSQFECKCGWQSSFESEFIEQYKDAQNKMRQSAKAGAA